ncbi:HEAT repeat domain-containing protein [Nonomuraea sp. NPDC004580]|uniref:HEAT repeat domain-containing protein n=1 Tax=Nonomuraea sp. NPDC004580 TaxID=3154552 RepID=UPI0033AE1290
MPDALPALSDPAWQVRAGAARCLAAADPALATEPLIAALSDPNLDVRKAAVLTLTTWSTDEAVATALEGALQDPDADVRAYARHALTSG